MAEAVQAAGSIIGGVAGYETGKSNRDLANNEAIQAERDGVAEEAAIREAARMAIGQQVAAQGENGMQIGSGSALDALMQSKVNATLDAMTAGRQAAARARAKRFEAKQAYAEGSNAMVQGFFKAGSQVASMKADWASARAGRTSPPPAPAGRRG